MDVDKQVWSLLMSMLEQSSATSEFEVAFPKASLDVFQRLLKYCRSVQYPMQEYDDVLDVSADGIRMSIESTESIRQYCKTGRADDGSKFMQKARLVSPVSMPEYGLKFQLREEIDITDPADIADTIARMSDTPKHFRYKKRYSFDLPSSSKSKMFRLDCTLVRESSRSFLRYAQCAAQMSRQQPQYEIEIEYVGPKELGKKEREPMLQALFGKITEVLQVLLNTAHLMGAQMKNTVLSEYSALTGARGGSFIAPKPITLELKHLLEPAEGRLSIRNGYCITDKSDGERHLVFVNGRGEIYLINSRMQVINTGMVVKDKEGYNSILDAEVVTQSSSTWLIMVFDAYFWHGEDIRARPLIDDRYSMVKQFANLVATTHDYTVRAKTFYLGGNNIFAQCDILLNRIRIGNMPYKTDGLIFQPVQDPVPAAGNVTWNTVFKWKPPHENSIDFLVVVDDERGMVIDKDSQKQLKQLKLHVGFNLDQTKLNPLEVLLEATQRKNSSRRPQQERRYVPVIFMPEGASQEHSYALVDVDDAGLMHCENGDILTNDSIVEFYFRDNKWIPMRERKDKTELYRQTGSISRAANDHVTALNVWKTIQNPVTEEHLKNGLHVEGEALNALLANDLYYDRHVSRDRMALRPMMDFHNQWVKDRQLLRRQNGRKEQSLLDLGCGKGGDLYKWKHAGFTKVLGLDVNEDNITNPLDGAYARARQLFGIGTGAGAGAGGAGLEEAAAKFLPYVFVQMDVSQPLNATALQTIEDADRRVLAEMLWGLQPAPRPELRVYEGYATKGFDVVSCQFAVHYFFKSTVTLDAFVDNVAKHLAPGGRFIGTCLDGPRVDQALQDVQIGDAIKGIKEDHTIWAIWKHYDAWNAEEENVGKEIQVYIETINRKVPEYLVDFKALTRRLERYNIVLEETSLFDALFQQLGAQQRNTLSPALKNALNMSPAERTYSFMNRWFVFRKQEASASASAIASTSADAEDKKSGAKKQSRIKTRRT